MDFTLRQFPQGTTREAVDLLNDLHAQATHAGQVAGADGITQVTYPGMPPMIRSDRPQAWEISFLARVMVGYFDGNADFKDARYWVKNVFMSQKQADYDTAKPLSVETTKLDLELVEHEAPWLKQLICATNLQELPQNTHTLTDGDFVLVHVAWGWMAKGSPGGPQSPYYQAYFSATSSNAGLFPVTLTTDTITSLGTQSAAPIITYKFPKYLISGKEILDSTGASYTGLVPRVGRWIGLVTAAATDGLGYFDSTGVFKLYRAYENEAAGACT